MWEPRRLTTLWSFTACYWDSFTFTFTLCNKYQVTYFSPFRAVYREADIYLLDDPLSAVDTRVGRHLFDDCICGFLEGKTRVLVTHQLQYLHTTDDIVILNNVRLS
jgi:ABC-type multidrug transport system fused ATPase/permease subunit